MLPGYAVVPLVLRRGKPQRYWQASRLHSAVSRESMHLLVLHRKTTFSNRELTFIDCGQTAQTLFLNRGSDEIIRATLF